MASNLSISCLGDSTTWGDNGTEEGSQSISWVAHIGALLGATDVRNYGVRGSRIAIKPDRDNSFVERWESCDMDTDIILVFGGVNDFNRAVPLGKMGDSDPHTFYGALDTLIAGIMNKYPESILIYCTPCKSTGRTDKNLPPYDVANPAGLYLWDYVAAIREVCDRYSVPVIDLYASSGISPVIPAHRKLYMPDGLHYSPAGYERLARRIAAGVKSIVCI